MFCVSPGIRSLLATLITFLVNTSWSTPTTDADGALDFVSGLHLQLRFGSAISGLLHCGQHLLCSALRSIFILCLLISISLGLRPSMVLWLWFSFLSCVHFWSTVSWNMYGVAAAAAAAVVVVVVVVVIDVAVVDFR